MSEPRIEDDDLAFERRLLGAGLAEPLPVERTEAALKRLTAEMAALSMAAGGSAAGSAPVADIGTGAGYLVAIKWLGLGALLGGIGTILWMQNLQAPPSSPSPPRVLPVTTVASPAPRSSAPLSEPAAALPPLPSKPQAPSEPRRALLRAPSAAAPTTKPSSDLAAEIAALDGIRTALAIGAWDDAEQKLGNYQRHFAQGALRSEAEVLRIETWVAKGNRVAAQSAAERFIALHPRDPQVARVRALVE